MTNRERLLTIMRGGRPDRIPWIPRMLLWHTAHARRGTLPPRFRGMSLREVERAVGIGTPARDGRVFREVQEGDVETSVRREGRSVVTTYRTPKGEVSTRFRSTEELDAAGIQSLEVEHMVKEPADLDAVTYMLEHTRTEPTYDAYLSYEKEIGDDGYPIVSAGDVPFHHFLQKLAGYETGFFMLADCGNRVGRLLELMEALDRERRWPLIADSPARLILHGVHFDSQLTPPPMFDRYITPYYKDLSRLLHSRGKTLCMHADNDSSAILDHIREAGYDMVETFTTDPIVNCTLEEARDRWGTSVIIWGAVPSVILEPAFSEEEFERYMRRVFRAVAPGDAFILGVADNVMPDAMPERIERITQMTEAWGNVPVRAERIPA
jgi:hypothetical protein